MHEIASTRVRYGFWRIDVLIRREGWLVNHKRVYRLSKEEGLNLRTKRPRRRKAAAHRLERPVLTAPNQSWSMDFVSDALFNGNKFRALTVVDNHMRECLAIEVAPSLNGGDVVRVLQAISIRRGMVPARIQADAGAAGELQAARCKCPRAGGRGGQHLARPKRSSIIACGEHGWCT